jgi:hypothetical protein
VTVRYCNGNSDLALYIYVAIEKCIYHLPLQNIVFFSSYSTEPSALELLLLTNKYQRISSFVFWTVTVDVDPLQMPPKHSGDLKKQKNLTAFFTKASTSGTTQAAKSTPFKTPNVKTAVFHNEGHNKNASRSQASSSPVVPKTPGSDSSDIRVDLTSAVPPSSVLSSRRASSPPTSDIIDVDMFASDDEEDQPVIVNITCAYYLRDTDTK